METHKYYKQAYDAYSGTSFSPEKRASTSVEWYDVVIKEFTDSGKEWAIEKFTKLYLKSLSAKSRIVPTMIAGPANFPVARMEKYNRWERAASDALTEFLDKVRKPPVGPRHEIDYNIQQKEYEINSVKIVHDTADNRIRLFFPGKPEQEMIVKLKKCGFKWSPHNKSWQRQLTPNAINATKNLLIA